MLNPDPESVSVPSSDEPSLTLVPNDADPDQTSPQPGIVPQRYKQTALFIY